MMHSYALTQENEKQQFLITQNKYIGEEIKMLSKHLHSLIELNNKEIQQRDIVYEQINN